MDKAELMRSVQSGEIAPVYPQDAAQRSVEKALKQLEDSIKETDGDGRPHYNDRKQIHFLKELDGFRKLFASFLPQRGRVIDWEKIKPPAEGMIIPYSDLGEVADEQGARLLDRLVVLKLNGGLGTSMGCTGPKSAIEVRTGNTFLDLTVQQIKSLNEKYDSDVPLCLMNSFNTHKTTRKILRKYKHGDVRIESFNQSRYPRIYKENFMPLPRSVDSSLEHWYPPGHGDVFPALYNSGLLDKFLGEGKEYIFISNIDNLGATVDFKILKYLAESDDDFIMEVTDKTRSDIKGGTLIDYEGKPKLLEIAQVPKNKVDEFKSVKKFKIFNTNNLWVRLRSIKSFIEQGSMDEIDIIVNQKDVDGEAVIQLERAAGAAIQFFKKAQGINVPRSRFLPVKDTSDLFLAQSDLYEMEEGHLMLDPRRQFGNPLVKLGEHFKKVADYNARFKGIPHILELHHLTVSGDVTFGANVTLAGTVIIVANHGAHISIPDGAYLENKVVSGNLQILDH